MYRQNRNKLETGISRVRVETNLRLGISDGKGKLNFHSKDKKWRENISVLEERKSVSKLAICSVEMAFTKRKQRTEKE